MDKEKIKLLKIFDKIEHKPIFQCVDQTIVYKGKKYTHMPKCVSVELSWEDWNKLRDAIYGVLNKRC